MTVECLACGCSNIEMFTKKGNGISSEIPHDNCILSQGDHNLTCWVIVVETTSIRCIGGAHDHDLLLWSTISVEMGTENLETSFFSESSSTNIAKSTPDRETSMFVFESIVTPECTNASTSKCKIVYMH